MKRENIGDAMEMLDDELLNDALEFRSRKHKARRMPKFAVAAAAVAVMVIGATTAAAVGGHFVDIKNIFGAVVGTQYVDATEDIKVSVLSYETGVSIKAEVVDPTKVPYSEFDSILLNNYTITDEDGNVLAAKGGQYGENGFVKCPDDVKEKLNAVQDTDEVQWISLGDGRNVISIAYLTYNNDGGAYMQIVDSRYPETDAVPEEDSQIFLLPAELCGKTLTLHIESFIGESKADQPLEIHGDWTVEFTI